jgi:hypothetical protein
MKGYTIMDITKLIESLPLEIKDHVIDWQDIQMGEQHGMCVMLDCILSPGQKALLQGNRHIMGLECVAQYAPEIKHSYFYMV